MNLKSMLIETKSAWVEYPGMPGFEVELVNLSRDKLISLRKSCTTTKINRSTRQPQDEVDEKKFVKAFTEATIKSWKGLKLSYLTELVLVDIGVNDPDKELDYSPENALDLVSSSSIFDGWVNEAVFDLENFRTGGKGTSVEAA